MLLSIDPGADCGWALFLTPAKAPSTLWACGLRRMLGEWPQPITRIVSEKPHTGVTRARKKDIITLAIRAGEVAGVWSYITGVVPEYIEPTRWKGNLLKERTAAIVKAKLRPEELKIFQQCCKKMAQSAQHNVLDAIGIGLYTLRR